MRISVWSSDGCSSDLLERRHGRKMAADHFAVVPADLGVRGYVFFFVGHVPGHAHDVLGPAAAFGQDGRDVFQRLPHLAGEVVRSEEHTSELQSLMRISYAVFCLKKKNKPTSYR